jgi:ribosome-associated protein
LSPKKEISTEEKIALVMAALEDRKAIDLVAINVRNRTTMADTIIIASGTSRVHIKSLADAVIDKMGEIGFKNKRFEGYDEGVWVLLDYGDVIVHVFAPEQREFYRLEAYWSGAEKGSPPPLSPSEI